MKRIISLLLVYIAITQLPSNHGYAMENFLEDHKTSRILNKIQDNFEKTLDLSNEHHSQEPLYLILSVRSPAIIPLHKILNGVPSKRLLLVAGSKFFSEEEKEKISPFFNTILRIDNYRDSGQLEMEVFKLYKEKPFQKVIAYHEYDLLRAARIRSFFKLEGQDYQSAIVFRDKIAMKELLAKAEIKVPFFARINSPLDIFEFTEKYGFPAVVKPIFGTGADGVFILKNIQDSEKFINKYKGFNDCHLTDLEIESFVKGTTYHVDGFVKDGAIIASWPSICINHCVDLKEGSYVAHHHLSPENPMVERLNNYTKTVLDALPTPKNTAFLLEIFYDEQKDDIVFCEIAARVGGGVKEMWPAAFEIDLENEFIRMQAGLELSPKLTQFSNSSTPTIQNISGWIIFPKPLGILKSIPEVTPFPWVKEYIVRAKSNILNLPTKNVSDSLASAFIVCDSEKQFKERADLLNLWIQKESQWEETFIPLTTVECIETCEKCMESSEKIKSKFSANCAKSCNHCITEHKEKN